MKIQHKLRLCALLTAGVAVLALLWLYIRPATKQAKLPIEISIAQGVEEAFSADLQNFLRTYAEQHPLVKVRVSYDSSKTPSADLSLRASVPDVSAPHPTKKSTAEAERGVPFFTADWSVLAFNRDLVARAPESFRSLIQLAEARKTEGKVVYGIALPEGTHDMLPFFGSALFADKPGEANSEATREAFATLSELRFARGLAPQGCTAECAVTMFSQRRAAFAVIGERRLADVERALGERLGLAPLPALSSGKLRTARTDYALYPRAGLSKSKQRAVSEIVEYLTQQSRSRVFAELNKLPLPLARSRAAQGGSRLETELASILETQSVAVSEQRLESGRALVEPVWSEFAVGKLGVRAASELLVKRIEEVLISDDRVATVGLKRSVEGVE